MIQILENVYAVNVPSGAEISINCPAQLKIVSSSGIEFINLTEAESFLGTVSPTEIDFDVPIFGDFVLPSFSNYEAQKLGFRSALTAAGITEYEKLIIIQKT